tara:strand:- start:202 stop:555 length:354 start_codon:yes stop_codon:yes gene_type:complete
LKNFKDKLFELANSKTLECSIEWKAMSDEMRIKKFKIFFEENQNFDKIFNLHDIKSDGQIILSFKEIINVKERGGILLDFEEVIKDKIDKGLTVWLMPIGDKSSLRNLRGIEIKDYE